MFLFPGIMLEYLTQVRKEINMPIVYSISNNIIWMLHWLIIWSVNCCPVFQLIQTLLDLNRIKIHRCFSTILLDISLPLIDYSWVVEIENINKIISIDVFHNEFFGTFKKKNKKTNFLMKSLLLLFNIFIYCIFLTKTCEIHEYDQKFFVCKINDN